MNDNHTTYRTPVVEREGELIAMILGAGVFGMALGIIVVGTIVGAFA